MSENRPRRQGRLGPRIPRCRFIMPDRGTLEPGGQRDPILWYYHPIVGWLYRIRIDRAVALLDPPYGAILEIGYGSGVLFPTLAKIGRELFGVDMDSDPVKVGRRLECLGISASLARGTLADLHYPDSGFDLVVAISLFEHIRELSLMVQEICRILRPGGHLLVGMPRVDRLMERLFPLIGFEDIGSHHVTTYRDFIHASCTQFDLIRRSHVPSFLPRRAGLYFNMLFGRNP